MPIDSVLLQDDTFQLRTESDLNDKIKVEDLENYASNPSRNNRSIHSRKSTHNGHNLSRGTLNSSRASLVRESDYLSEIGEDISFSKKSRKLREKEPKGLLGEF